MCVYACVCACSGGVLEEGLTALNVGLDGLGTVVPAGRAHLTVHIRELERV